MIDLSDYFYFKRQTTIVCYSYPSEMGTWFGKMCWYLLWSPVNALFTRIYKAINIDIICHNFRYVLPIAVHAVVSHLRNSEQLSALVFVTYPWKQLTSASDPISVVSFASMTFAFSIFGTAPHPYNKIFNFTLKWKPVKKVRVRPCFICLDIKTSD